MLASYPNSHHKFPSRHRAQHKHATAIDNPLTAQERRDYEKLTTTIRKGMAMFVEVGLALKEVRDQKLYREAYETFGAYCRTEWDIGRAYA